MSQNEIPASWGLKQKRRDDGRVDVVGTDDAGREYTAITTEGDAVTEKEVSELQLGDREQSDAKTFTEHFIKEHDRNKAEFEAQIMEEDFAIAESICRDSYRRSPRQCVTPVGPTKVTFGTSRKIRRGWPKDWPQGISE